MAEYYARRQCAETETDIWWPYGQARQHSRDATSETHCSSQKLLLSGRVQTCTWVSNTLRSLGSAWLSDRKICKERNKWRGEQQRKEEGKM
jgi:hypothetical protein